MQPPDPGRGPERRNPSGASPAGRYNPEQRRRHHDAHERVARAHESAANTHDRVARHFEGLGDTARAERERDAAAKERLKARFEHDTAREFDD